MPTLADEIVGYRVLKNSTLICVECSYLWPEKSDLEAIMGDEPDVVEYYDLCDSELS